MPKAAAAGCWNWAAESGWFRFRPRWPVSKFWRPTITPKRSSSSLANAQHNGLTGIATRCVDWRQYPADLVGFDLIVASDVLYERPNAALVAAAIAHSLAPHGVALVTDPGRQVARPFADECRQRGLECDCVDLEQIVDGQIDSIVELYEIGWQRLPPAEYQQTAGGHGRIE